VTSKQAKAIFEFFRPDASIPPPAESPFRIL
jgi:hypothetical protein